LRDTQDLSCPTSRNEGERGRHVQPSGTKGPAVELASRPVRTRLQAPLLRADVISRQRLIDALNSAVNSYRVILVSAPAGYGKTTLLAALSNARPELPLAWLSLEEEDNDPARFLTALIAALERLNLECCSAAQHLLDTLDNPASQAYLSGCTRDVDRDVERVA
jgi:LuxR family transcriptional regulator, maltose regulon positive regulatory protein